jgi:hypothetical protein
VSHDRRRTVQSAQPGKNRRSTVQKVVKLSPKQRETLDYLGQDGGHIERALANEWRVRGDSLVEHGLAARRKIGKGFFFRLTDAGRAMLPPKPVMDLCVDCQGSGEVQQICEVCRVALTEKNWSTSNDGYVCNKCVEPS